MSSIILGCVGKPSAGKSTFFNAVTQSLAKVGRVWLGCSAGSDEAMRWLCGKSQSCSTPSGMPPCRSARPSPARRGRPNPRLPRRAQTGNFPFTTIEPNTGVTFYLTPCVCASHGKSDVCAPRHGYCERGVRHVPVKLLDVAGLVPGASEGRGLGNKFLDDLRHAHVLLHIIDASGCTNEKGENTVGYDPSRDHEWLQSEIHAWIYNNLAPSWPATARRHNMTKSSVAKTLQTCFSGYGSKEAIVVAVVDALGVKEPADLAQWDADYLHRMVDTFIAIRFPTVLVLNKADQGGDTARNIERICTRWESSSTRCIVASAAAECFLKKARTDGYIR
jgi:ribosome-binding ATPase YchF (GTP1/OBG family)